MGEWAGDHQTLIWWVGAVSALSLVMTLVAIPVLVVRLPTDYFVHRKPPADSWRARHRAVRLTMLTLKNALGGLIVLAGIVLSVPLIPGQGFLTILIGLMLLDFPGKRRLELRIVRQRTVLAAINWIRTRSRKPPLALPPS